VAILGAKDAALGYAGTAQANVIRFTYFKIIRLIQAVTGEANVRMLKKNDFQILKLLLLDLRSTAVNHHVIGDLCVTSGRETFLPLNLNNTQLTAMMFCHRIIIFVRLGITVDSLAGLHFS
jgi:hypothetical protein